MLFDVLIDALAAKQIATFGALFGVLNNILADRAVEYFPLQVGKSIFFVTILTHFVDFASLIDIFL